MINSPARQRGVIIQIPVIILCYNKVKYTGETRVYIMQFNNYREMTRY